MGEKNKTTHKQIEAKENNEFLETVKPKSVSVG